MLKKIGALSILVGIASILLQAATALSQGDDVLNLLKDADSALTGKKSTPEKSEEPESKSEQKSGSKAASKRKAKSQKAGEESVDAKPTIPGDQPKSESDIKPLNITGLDQVLAIDRAAQNKEHQKPTPQTYTRLGVGQLTVRDTYLLEKDDDQFVASPSDPMTGYYIGLDTQWRLDSLSLDTLYSHFTAEFGAGFYSGDMHTVRSGIFKESGDYKYRLAPLDISLGYQLSYQFLSLQFLLGLGADMISQIGKGESDNITDIFFRDHTGARLTTHINDKWDLSLGIFRKGIGLINFPRGSANQMIIASIGLNVSG